jgi:hypothetical protein
VLLVDGKNPFDDQALIRLAGSDRAVVDGGVTLVNPQLALAGRTVRTVAGEAVLG